MAANDFEKQVQQKMEELRLRPSGEVWQEVELRIRKEKRRRFLLWLIPMLLVLLAGGSWLLYDGRYRTTTHSTPISQQHNPNSTLTIKKDDNTVPGTDGQPSMDSGVANNSTNERQLNQPGNKARPAIIPATKAKRENNHTRKYPTRPQPANEKPAVSYQLSNPPVTKRREQTPTKQITNQEPTAPVTNNKRNHDKDSIAKMVTVPVTNTDVVVANTTDKKDSVISTRTTSIDTATIAKKRNTPVKRKWKTYLNASAGISTPSLNLGSKKGDGFANPNMGGGGGPVITAPSTPAPATTGFGWRGGIQFQRSLTPRTAISAGLNLSVYGTHQRTGEFVDSSRTSLLTGNVNGFYRNGSVNNYHNHFYYLEIPLTIDWQINKGSKLPLTWQNGINAGWLLATNALVYDSGSNIFIRDKKSFNNLQLGYYSSFYASFINKKGHPFTAGLYLNYQLSPLQRSSPVERNHLLGAGLRIGYLLKK